MNNDIDPGFTQWLHDRLTNEARYKMPALALIIDHERMNAGQVGDILRAMLEDWILEEIKDPSGLAADLIRQALSRADWSTIGETILQEWQKAEA